MEINIILTHCYFLCDDEKEQNIVKPYPPLGILYISAWLEKFGYQNTVYDSTFNSRSKQEQFLLKQKPTVIGLYTNLMTKLNLIHIIKFIKEHEELKNTVVILGGPDIRYNIEDYLSTGADVLVVGEGEQTILELVKTVENGNLDEFGHVDGVAYRSKSDGIVVTKQRDKIKNIDELPWPNRDKIDMFQYLKIWKEEHGGSAMTVSTQRGCPYTCKWCSTAVYGQSYRRRSPRLVAKELKHLRDRYNPDTIWFVDDVFTVSHKWLEEFRNEVVLQDAIIPFECITRADRMNEDVVMFLKEAGAFRIWIGAESGSQKVIDLMDRRVDVHKVREMIQLTKKNGLEAGTFIMLGYPGETQEDIIATKNHLRDCDPDHFTITIAYPIKGTSLYQEVESVQTEHLVWQETTDRDRDFKRTYPRKYYDFAVRWVENEVRWQQSIKSGQRFLGHSLYTKLKSVVYRGMMWYAK